MRARRDARQSVDIWPGFVDALSTLLLAVIFMLVVFVLAQFFLSQLLQTRDQAVRRLETTIRQLEAALAAEQDITQSLQRGMGQAEADLQLALRDRDLVAGHLEDALTAGETVQKAATRLQTSLDEARETMAADRDRLELQLTAAVQLRRDIAALDQVRERLEGRVAELAAASEANATERTQLLTELGTTRDRGKALEAELASAAERTMLSQHEVEAGRLKIDQLIADLQSSQRARDEEAVNGTAAAKDAARLSSQVTALSGQLGLLDRSLAERERENDRQNDTIADLSRRLDTALANKVEELSRYRSDFFGKLRQVLGDRENVRIVGDRFVFQSEVLFRSGEAEIGLEGFDQLAKLAAAFKEILPSLPSDLPWVLQVDGHTDRRPISTPRFRSNWELSTARAISVAQFLIGQGIPPERVAARGFAEFAPLDSEDSEAARQRNRRIEVKLTTR